jgi:hypothetical protein
VSSVGGWIWFSRPPAPWHCPSDTRAGFSHPRQGPRCTGPATRVVEQRVAGREKVGVGDTRSRCTGSQQRAEAPLTCHAFPDATAPLQKFGPFYGSLGEYYQIGRKEFLVSYIIKVFRPFEPIRIDPTTQRRTRFAYEVSTPTGVWLRSRARVARAPPPPLPVLCPLSSLPSPTPGTRDATPHSSGPGSELVLRERQDPGPQPPNQPGHPVPRRLRALGGLHAEKGRRPRWTADPRAARDPSAPWVPSSRVLPAGAGAIGGGGAWAGRFVRGRGQGGRGGASAGRRGPRGDGRVQGEGPRARRPCAPAPTAGGMRPDPAPRTRPRQRLEDVDSVWVSERLQISGPHGPDLGNRTPVWVFLCRKGASCFPSAPLHFRAAIIRI